MRNLGSYEMEELELTVRSPVTSLADFWYRICSTGIATDRPEPAKLAVKLVMAETTRAVVLVRFGHLSGS